MRYRAKTVTPRLRGKPPLRLPSYPDDSAWALDAPERVGVVDDLSVGQRQVVQEWRRLELTGGDVSSDYPDLQILPQSKGPDCDRVDEKRRNQTIVFPEEILRYSLFGHSHTRPATASRGRHKFGWGGFFFASLSAYPGIR